MHQFYIVVQNNQYTKTYIVQSFDRQSAHNIVLAKANLPIIPEENDSLFLRIFKSKHEQSKNKYIIKESMMIKDLNSNSITTSKLVSFKKLKFGFI